MDSESDHQKPYYMEGEGVDNEREENDLPPLTEDSTDNDEEDEDDSAPTQTLPDPPPPVPGSPETSDSPPVSNSPSASEPPPVPNSPEISDPLPVSNSPEISDPLPVSISPSSSEPVPVASLAETSDPPPVSNSPENSDPPPAPYLPRPSDDLEPVESLPKIHITPAFDAPEEAVDENETAQALLPPKSDTNSKAHFVFKDDDFPDKCDDASNADCTSGKNDQGQNQDQDERKSSSSSNPGNNDEACEDGSCQTQITLGEPEKEQLKSIGKHLLQIGRQLLEEMDFVENLLGKFGSFVYDGNSKSSRMSQLQEALQSVPKLTGEQKGEKDTCAIYAASASNPTEDSKEKVLTEEEINSLKSQLIDALAAQAKRLNMVHQKTEEYDRFTKGALFGSAFATPQASLITSNNAAVTAASPACNSNNVSGDIRKTLAVIEMKLDKLGTRLETCEQQIPEVYNNLHGLITKIVEDFSTLREDVGTTRNASETAKGDYDNRINYLDKQVMRLAQIVWELKCETRVQMHFGREQ